MNHAPDPITVADERRADAELREALGERMDPALVDRIAARLADASAPARPRTTATFVGIAAVMLLGLGVVVALATGVFDERRAEAGQDPQGAGAVTDATLRKASYEPPAAAPADERMLAIAKAVRGAVVTTAGVDAHSAVEVPADDAREAIELIAREHGYALTEHLGVLLVRAADGPTLPRAAKVTLQARGLTTREFAKRLHAKVGVSLLLADDAGAGRRVDVDVTDAPWRALLDAVAARLDVEVVGCGEVLALRSRTGKRAPRPRVALNFRRTPVTRLFDVWAKMAGANLVVAPGFDVPLSTAVMAPKAEVPLAALAAAAGGRVQQEDRGITRICPLPPALVGRTTTLTGERLAASDVASYCAATARAPFPIEADSDATATVTAFVASADVPSLVDALAAALRLQVKEKGGGYSLE